MQHRSDADKVKLYFFVGKSGKLCANMSARSCPRFESG